MSGDTNIRLNHTRTQKSALVSCCGAHLAQDGLSALQYVLLPILSQALGLNYSQVGLLKAVANISMSALEIPSGLLSEITGERRLLVFGLVTAGAGYVGVALSSGFIALALFFLLVGVGAAFQHSLASAVLANTFSDAGRRKALGTYNSFGDVGKLLYTGAFSLGIGAGLSWNALVIALGLSSMFFGLIVYRSLRGYARDRVDHPTTNLAGSAQTASHATATHLTGSRWGIASTRRFSILGLTVFLDGMVQSIFLTFIAFILLERGVSTGTATAGVVIALTGGMVGKFCCGYLAASIGDRLSYTLIQCLTLLALAGLVYLPLNLIMIALPFIGLVVQGTSTISYGAVADFVDAGKQSRGYALIYTMSTASSVVGPFSFGFIADRTGLASAMLLLTVIVALTIPTGFVLNGRPDRIRLNVG